MANGQERLLQGTIEFYQARTNTKITVTAERLAVIAWVLATMLPVVGEAVTMQGPVIFGVVAVAAGLAAVAGAAVSLTG